MALVSQEVLLFSGTVLDNIQFGCPEAALGEVVEAARAAHAHEFIMQLPDGYNTRLGEIGSVQLSGEWPGTGCFAVYASSVQQCFASAVEMVPRQSWQPHCPITRLVC